MEVSEIQTLRALVDERSSLLADGSSPVETRAWADALAEAEAASDAGDLHGAVRLTEQASLDRRRRLEPVADTDDGHFHAGRTSFLALSVAFVVFLTCAMWELSRDLYVASLAFYTLVGACVGVLAAASYLHGKHRSGSILAQILALAVIVKFHYLYLNPYVYTSDSFLFYAGLADLRATGYLSVSLGHYFYFPGLATFAFAGVALTRLPLELFAAFGFVSQIAMIPVVYLLGRFVVGRRAGLIAALFAMLWIYSFLWMQANPTQYGLTFLFLGIYSVMRIRPGAAGIWLVVFWISGLAALFSHPINALVFAMVLILRVVRFAFSPTHLPRTQSAAGPAVSYAVMYVSYLVYLAVTTFSLFVRTFFVTDYEPPLATIPGGTLDVTSLYVIQSAIAPLSLAILMFFAAYAVFAKAGISRTEHGFLVILGVVFLSLPGVELVAGNFKFQSSRFLVYLSIPLVLLGAHGLIRLSSEARRRRTLVGVFAVFLLLGFLSTSSYLTQGDSQALYTQVPFAPNHFTESALSSRQFLLLTSKATNIYMDLTTWRYLADTDRAPHAMRGYTTFQLDQFGGQNHTGLVVLNAHYIPYGDPSAGTFYNITGIESTLLGTHSSLLYDSGDVVVYSS